MAKTTIPKDDRTFSEVRRHYDWASQETDRRRTGRGRIGSISFDEADELFRSWLDESKWPYDALLFDPRVFTFIFEKTSRLLSNKLRGRLIPREGGDVLAAHVNNALLNYQWDQATHGGTMLSKWSVMDLNTRKYGASFAVCKWRYEKDPSGRVVFDGPEMTVLNNRDCLPDPAATSIENANWFQVREYITIQELERVNDSSRSGPIYKNVKTLKRKISEESNQGGDTRDSNWISRNRTISGLVDDPVGKDEVFKTIEIVTEYRRDKWITFAPKHGVVLREVDNPYGNYELPIVMLRYYQIDDDLYGMSEIEPIKGLQKAINALLSEYVDEINQKLHTPVAIGPGVREHTLIWGTGARWRMNNPLSDFRLVESKSNAAQYFNNTYSALVAALGNAVGESSLGISNINRFNPEKTATEVKQLMQQRNARDNYNQNMLAEAIQRQMMLWHQMNQKMVFADEDKKTYVIRIVGNEAMDYFKRKGLDVMEPDMGKIDDALNPNDPIMGREDIPFDALKPKFPVNLGTSEKPNMVPKMEVDEEGSFASIHVEPEDLKGNFDFIADVEAMSLQGADDVKQGRRTAVSTILSSPVILELLARENVKPKFRDLFVAWLEDTGFKNADKFFEQMPQEEIAAMQAEAQGQNPGEVNQGQGRGNTLSQEEAQTMPGGLSPESLLGGPQPAGNGQIPTATIR